MTSLCPGPLADSWLLEGFCASELPVSIGRPRSLVSLGTTDLLVMERDTRSIVYVSDEEGDDGLVDTKVSIATAPTQLNHGLTLHGGYLYASSSSHVYRWNYNNDLTQLKSNLGDPETVVNNINPDGQGGAPEGHSTRTIKFDGLGRLYVSIGSVRNVDQDSYRSRIRRFNVSDPSLYPLDFTDGEVFADGLRNEVGLAFDRHGVLWGVENGADNLYREDLGGDIHQDNPGEELNRFKEKNAGKHWGYPYCWTEYDVPVFGGGQGTVWTWPDFLGRVTDEQCRTDYMESVLSMQGHSAPLGIAFYDYKPPSELPDDCPGLGSFPAAMDGFAFIAFHGSWNRDIPTGYKVVYIEMNAAGDAVGQTQDLLRHDGVDAQWASGYRPVDVAFDTCGRLIVTSDGTRGVGDNLVRISSMLASNDTLPPTTSPSSAPSLSDPTFSLQPSTKELRTNDHASNPPIPSSFPTAPSASTSQSSIWSSPSVTGLMIISMLLF